mmetsp:Transcript_2337/g.5241  ORF Transcript_2337/g.5241 Transcript_2337/m.5241 type:complete len:248 (+) Transcript_2337:1960-2703(+)
MRMIISIPEKLPNSFLNASLRVARAMMVRRASSCFTKSPDCSALSRAATPAVRFMTHTTPRCSSTPARAGRTRVRAMQPTAWMGPSTEPVRAPATVAVTLCVTMRVSWPQDSALLRSYAFSTCCTLDSRAVAPATARVTCAAISRADRAPRFTLGGWEPGVELSGSGSQIMDPSGRWMTRPLPCWSMIHCTLPGGDAGAVGVGAARALAFCATAFLISRVGGTLGEQLVVGTWFLEQRVHLCRTPAK